MKHWGALSSLFVSVIIAGMAGFIAVNALFGFSTDLFTGWNGLWKPIYGSIRLLLLSGVFAVPMGLCMGIYLSEFTKGKVQARLISLLESTAGLPSIIIGFFGFILILFINRYVFPVSTSLLSASFCLAVLVLPSLALNTYTALRAVPDSLRITGASLGLSVEGITLKVLIPAASEGVFSGLLMAAGRCAEDTAVILLTGAVASTGTAGILGKFEALPFFIYYTSANYTDEAQLAQVFAAAFILLGLTLVFMMSAMLLKNYIGRTRGMLWMR